MSYKSKEIREQANVVAEEMKTLVTTCKKDGKNFTGEQREQFDKLESEFQRLRDEAESTERMERFETLTQTRNEDKPQVRELRTRKPVSIDSAFSGWLRHKAKCLDYATEKSCEGFDLRSNEFSFNFNPNKVQHRASTDPQSSSASNLGVELIPTEIPADISTFMIANSPIRQIARPLTTPNGHPFSYPVSNDTANAAVIISESTQDTVNNVPFDKVQSVVYTFSSGVVLLPYEWITDSVVDVKQYIVDEMQRRFLRGTSTYLATGTGSSQPLGYVKAAGVGVTMAGTTAPTYAELSTWYDSVPLFYQQQPKFAFIVAPSVRKALREMVDDDGRPLWSQSFQSGLVTKDQDSLFGRPLYVDSYLQALGSTSHLVGCAGDFDQFVIRSVEQDNLRMVVLSERYADYRQIGIFGYARLGSFALQAGGLKSLKCATS